MHAILSERSGRYVAAGLGSLIGLALVGGAGGSAWAAGAAEGKTLTTDTRFFTPAPAQGSLAQAVALQNSGHVKEAKLIVAMEVTPQAVWLTQGTPAQVAAQVKQVMAEAAEVEAVPVFVAYNIPGRDCGSYSAGGAETTADYEAWIAAVAGAIGSGKAVVALEPDALANLPSDCGYPATVDATALTTARYTQIQYAVTALEAGAGTSVYLDAGNSSWQAVPTIAARLAMAGGLGAQGFFSNVSNFRETAYETKFDTWVSECIAFANNATEGGWRLGHYDWCASQYYSPDGAVNPNDITTWKYTDEWFAANLGTAVPTMHFIVDTGRNGQGPLDATVYETAPWNQPNSVEGAIAGGSWCNPPGRGVGLRPTANTGVALLDAYLWVKTPGQSDGTCDAAGGARAWDYAAYTQAGWPTTAATQATFDPLWGLFDPIAGSWFPQEALELAKQAVPALKLK